MEEQLYLWKNSVDKTEFNIGVRVGKKFDTITTFNSQYLEELFGLDFYKKIIKIRPNSPMRISIQISICEEE